MNAIIRTSSQYMIGSDLVIIIASSLDVMYLFFGFHKINLTLHGTSGLCEPFT